MPLFYKTSGSSITLPVHDLIRMTPVMFSFASWFFILLFQQVRQSGKGAMAKAIIRGFITGPGSIGIGNLVTGMLIFMAIKTQQFPVTSIRWIIVMVVIFMVYREFTQPLAAELPPAMPANVGKKFESPFPITFFPLFPYTKRLRNTPFDIAFGINHAFYIS